MNKHVASVATQVMVMAIVVSVILLFVGIGVLVLIHLCIVGRAVRRGFGDGNVVERGSFGSTSMSQDDIERLPCFDFKARDDKGSSPVDCAVCLENFKAGDKCRLLPLCKHSFHAQCVDLWLLKTPICPICRTNTDVWKGVCVSGEGSSRFSESGMELRESQTTESGRFSEIAVELREGQTMESEHLGYSGVEIVEIPVVESTHLSGAAGAEPRENQMAFAGTELSLNPSPLKDSEPETSACEISLNTV